MYRIQWCQPCHVPISLEIWHQSQWLGVEKEVLENKKIRISFQFVTVSFLWEEKLLFQEGSSSVCFVYHWEFSLKHFFNGVIVKCPVLLCICLRFLKTKPVLGEVRCVCFQVGVYEWFCLLFGCVFRQRFGTLINNFVCCCCCF